MTSANSKAQSWSIDVILGVIIFIAAFFIFYGLLNENPNTKSDSLKEEASAVIRQIGSESSLVRVIDNNEINTTKAGALKNAEYGKLKGTLRIEGDFCVYLEDEEGNLVLINDSYQGIGAQNIDLGSTPCSQR